MRGLRFTETMRGFCSTAVTDDYARAAARGELDGSPLEFTVTVATDDLDRFLSSPSHEARLAGQVTAPALSPSPLAVRNGIFRLLVEDPTHVHARRMEYEMTLDGAPGGPLRPEGFKQIHDDSSADIWADTTTLFTTVHAADSSVLARGVLHILPADFMHQMTTMDVTGAANPIDALDGAARFGLFFAGALFDIYGGVFARATELNPNPTPRVRRPLKMSPPEVHAFTTGDGVGLRLTRYRGGAKGPVIVSPGYGTSTLAFTIDTVDTNLPEALYAAGYDVWLFDYRASPALPSSHTQFTLDDVATQDYPAAVATILKETGASSVQAMVHCVGSITFLMAQMAGLQHVRSAICSALTCYPVSPLHEMFGVANITAFNHITAIIRAGQIVDHKGDDTYFPHLDRLAIPITFLHGAENQLFLPEGSDKTLKTLGQRNDATLYERILIPKYAHMDCFIGKDAARDVFPLIVSELDRFN